MFEPQDEGLQKWVQGTSSHHRGLAKLDVSNDAELSSVCDDDTESFMRVHQASETAGLGLEREGL